MKVQFKEAMAGSQVVYNTIDVYDLPKEQANRLIDKGICKEFVDDEIEVKKVAVIKSNAVNKKVKK